MNHDAPSLRGVLLGARSTAFWERREEDLTFVEREEGSGGENFKGRRERHLESLGTFRYSESHSRRCARRKCCCGLKSENRFQRSQKCT